MNETATVAEVGDIIRHIDLLDFPMTVVAVEPCETGSPHRAYKVIDPDGRENWLCAHDVIKDRP